MVICTMAEVLEESAALEYHKFLADMPIGPLKNDNLAKQAINEYANKCGFSVIFQTSIMCSNQK